MIPERLGPNSMYTDHSGEVTNILKKSLSYNGYAFLREAIINKNVQLTIHDTNDLKSFF